MKSFRDEAVESVTRARAEFNSGESHRLRYAALELRFAIETLVYDRAHSYGDDFPEAERLAWQPQQVLRALVLLDPMTSEDFSMCIEHESLPEGGINLGKAKSLTMRHLNTHYHRLGNFLHSETLKQRTQDSEERSAQVRSRIEGTLEFLEERLDAQIINMVAGSAVDFPCERTGCGNTVRRFVPESAEEVRAECVVCNARYRILLREREFEVRREGVRIDCPNPQCGREEFVWPEKVEIGNLWTCTHCNEEVKFFRVIARPKGPLANTDTFSLGFGELKPETANDSKAVQTEMK